MADINDVTYFANTDADLIVTPTNKVALARQQCALLADWAVANLQNTRKRERALKALRYVELELVEAVVYDIDNPIV